MSGKPKGKVLKDAQVVLNRVYQKNIVHNTIFSWRVPNYEKLSSNVMYFQLYESIDTKCAFRLFKAEKFLCLTVASPNILQNTLSEFLIVDEVNNASVISKADKISDGVFSAKIPYEKFLYSGSNFLLKGVLTVAFKFVSDFYNTYNEKSINETEVLSDLDELCCDLKTMYLDSIYPDFLIHVRDYTFKSHKFILAARSRYFESLLEADQNMEEHRLTGDVLPGIMHEALVYLYSGEMREMDIDSMLRMYKLAADLDASSLCDRCIDVFKNRTDRHNYEAIYNFAVKFDLETLKDTVTKVVAKELPYVKLPDGADVKLPDKSEKDLIAETVV